MCIVKVLLCNCNEVERSLEDPLFLLVHYISLRLLERFARTPKQSFWSVFELAKEMHLDYLEKADHILNKQSGSVCKRLAAGVLAPILKRPASGLLMDNSFEWVEPTGFARPSFEVLKDIASACGGHRAKVFREFSIRC